MNPYTLERIENWVGDFCASDTARSYAADVQEAMAPVLVRFLSAACEHQDHEPDELTEDDTKHALLEHVARLDVSDAVRDVAPRLAADLLRQLEDDGRLARGRALGSFVRALAPAFGEASTGRVKPIVRPGSRLGRNDPCPCGSGKKYKKCCMQ